ncbi:olfactory receptor 5AN1-like [Latimeria chalumnae]|uniref:Olfactory receptor n=1 Tax=Latimeria chalumnae TaxID=7897 RepID=H3A9U7_LATCH
MTEFNQTFIQINGFILIGFPRILDLQSRAILSTVCLVAYIALFLGNLTFLVLMKVDHKLHSPMYLFICNLALVDIIYPSITIPKFLSGMMFRLQSIEYVACLAQMFFYSVLFLVETFTLVFMALDRYLAICNPLYYHSKMTNRHAIALLVLCWVAGVAVPMSRLLESIEWQFCAGNSISHYFCGYSAVAVLACNRVASDIISLSIVLFAYTLVSGLFIFSYTKIIISVLKIASSEGRRKAFSTCASHLVVIAVFILCSLLVSIINRIPRFSIDVRNMVSLVQHMLPPLANPIIYSLRTKEIRDSFKRLLKRSLTAPNSN